MSQTYDVMPDDVLVIHYTDLAPDPTSRLQLLSRIGKLFNKQRGLYSQLQLQLNDEGWALLCAWIQGQPQPFWREEQGCIRVLTPCTKHMIVGTGALLEDLGQGIPEPDVRPTLAQVWVAAKHIALSSPS